MAKTQPLTHSMTASLLAEPLDRLDHDATSQESAPVWDISPDTILKAAQHRYGPDVQVSAPYWVDAQRVRVGILLAKVDVSFGADFLFQAGRFA